MNDDEDEVQDVEEAEGEGELNEVQATPAGSKQQSSAVATGLVATAEAKTSPPAVDTKFLKILVGFRDGRCTLAIQDTGTDPVMSLLEGGLEDIFAAQVVAKINEAREHWKTSPKNKKYDRPAPPPSVPAAPRAPSKPAPKPVAASPATRRIQGSATAKAAAVAPKPLVTQQSMFE